MRFLPNVPAPSAIRRVARNVAGRVAERVRNDRRGSALILALVMTVSLAGLATSAVYLAGNATMLATSFDRERDFKYASEAALAIGKSRLNTDPLAVPDTGYTQILSNANITGADGQPIPNLTVNMYVGPTSSNTGQFGKFVSVVTEARDTRGARFVRRLELAQESFAKYAYWSNSESNSGSTIYFGGNDNLWGPVWSNDVIHMYSTGATFHSDVGTAQYIENPQYGTFEKGYSQHQHPITLPNNTVLGNLPGYATAGSMNFTAPNTSDVSGTMMRIEFEAVDLNGDGKVTGADEGFLKVYVAGGSKGTSDWLRGDWSTSSSNTMNCGASLKIPSSADVRTPVGPYFIPASAAVASGWFGKILNYIASSNTAKNNFRSWNGNFSSTTLNNLTGGSDATVWKTMLSLPTAACYLGGDPHLAGVERWTNATYGPSANNALSALSSSNYNTLLSIVGGDSKTWTDSSAYGRWLKWTGTVDARVQTARPHDYARLFPIYRGLNSGTKGVVYVNGTTGISGTMRGRITLYATGNVAVLDDLRYATDPSVGVCGDVLGVIGAKNIMVADNALNGPQNSGSGYRNYDDDNQDVILQGVLMALNTSFGAENYDGGPTDANGCEGQANGRGCLYITGGLIQDARGAVGTFSGSGGTGYTKRYSYDHCALYNPPPYFPTTGRYTDNRYYEIDPAHFNVAKLYQSLTPGQ
jgi:hypothetical protein